MDNDGEIAMRELCAIVHMTIDAPSPHVIKLQDCWIHDNEGMDDDFLATLGKHWRSVLAKDDAANSEG